MAQWRQYEGDPGWQYLKQPDEVRMKDQSKPYDSKTDVWVPDPEMGFLAAKITKKDGDKITVTRPSKGDGDSATFKANQISEMNPPKFTKAEDMSSLSFLNDASVLTNLRDRYEQLLIYTYSGLFCVVINPYKRLPIYTDSIAGFYMGKRKNEMPPHLWANSDEAFRYMQRGTPHSGERGGEGRGIGDNQNQSMLITGESGAGKTENTKKVIVYFAAVGAAQGGGSAPKDGEKKITLEDQIVQTNPVLEAFGNAKTVRNNNSSRFGKFIRIHFSKQGKVAGCDIENYLLEKSRVIRQAPGERCYHIFYQIMSGWNPKLRESLELDQEVAYYHFIAQAELTIAGVDDKEEHGMTDEAFDALNFSGEEKHNIYRLVAALMHMGEMKFRQRGEQAEPEDDISEVKKTANCYGVDDQQFITALCKPRVKVGTEWVNKGQNAEQVLWTIGATAKGVYNRLFNFLVEKCNLTLDAKEHPRHTFIGVLDIAGFEIFDFNSFEQLWINFVNEKLQQFFNHHMFVLEQEEYKQEGIVWVFIDFGLDLAACITLIEQPMGVISMLDEECVVPKGTDLTYAQKMTDKYLGKVDAFQKPKPPKGKQAEAHFALGHYAGIVRYNVSNWLEKNKDPLNDTVITCFKASKSNALLVHTWGDFQTAEEAAAVEKAGGSRKKGKSASMMTVSMLYRISLNNLMTMLNSTHPHFIRCIIPNEIKKSGYLDAPLVMHQLTCNGVLEGIRICRKGFPNRQVHPEFRVRYSILAPEAALKEDPKDASAGIMKQIVKEGKMAEEDFRIGHTKVFFKAGILAKMEDLRDEKVAQSVMGIQGEIRWNFAQQDYLARFRQLQSFTIVQKNIKNWSILRTWNWYLLYGKIRPMLGQTAKEIEECTARIKEVEAILASDQGMNELKAKNEALMTRSEEVAARLEETRTNANAAKDRVSNLAKEVERLEQGNQELGGIVKTLEAKNSDVTEMNNAASAESADLNAQLTDLEACLKKAEEEKTKREEAIMQGQLDKAAGDDNLMMLNRDIKDLSKANGRYQDDIASAEQKIHRYTREQNNLSRRLADMEDAMDRDSRSKHNAESQSQNLQDSLKAALEKIDGLSTQVSEAEQRLKAKERDVANAHERLKDENSRCLRLEHQLIDLATAATGLTRPYK